MARMRIQRPFGASVAHVDASEHDASVRCNTDKKLGGDRAEKSDRNMQYSQTTLRVIVREEKGQQQDDQLFLFQCIHVVCYISMLFVYMSTQQTCICTTSGPVCLGPDITVVCP